MSYNLYMLGIGIASLFSWSAWGLTVTKLTPCLNFAGGMCLDGNGAAIAAFYITLFLALTGTCSLAGFYIRVWLKGNEVYYRNVHAAFRQGALISLEICLLLALQSVRVLTWWDGLIVVLIFVLIELAFLKKTTRAEMN